MSVLQPSARAVAHHAELVAELAEGRRSNDRSAHLLLRNLDSGVHVELGYRDLTDYAENGLQLSAHKAHALIEICRHLPDLPELAKALSEGRIGWTKARKVARIATASTEAEWVTLACTTNSQVLERQVSGCKLGERPRPLGQEKAPERSRLVFNTATVHADLIRDAIQEQRALADVSRADVDDGAILAEIVRRGMVAIENGCPPTTERYRVLIEHCPSCGTTEGVDAELTDTMKSQALEHAEVVDLRPGPDRGKLTRTIPATRQRVVKNRDRMRCRVPGCRNRIWMAFHHVKEWAKGGDHREENLVTTCTTHHDQIHEGRLGVEVEGKEFVFRFADGRVVRTAINDRSVQLRRGAASPLGVWRGGYASAPPRGEVA